MSCRTDKNRKHWTEWCTKIAKTYILKIRLTEQQIGVLRHRAEDEGFSSISPYVREVLDIDDEDSLII